MSLGGTHLNKAESAVLALVIEDAFALWEVAAELGGDRTAAASVVGHLLQLGLVELGVEDWSDDEPAFIGTGSTCPYPSLRMPTRRLPI